MFHLTRKFLDPGSDEPTWFLDREEIGFNPVTHKSFVSLVSCTSGTKDHCLACKQEIMDDLGLGTEQHRKRQQAGIT